MFPAHLYFPIFLTICYVLVLAKIIGSVSLPDGILTRERSKLGYYVTWALGLFIILFFGFRPIGEDSLMADTYGYATIYNELQNESDIWYRVTMTDDFGNFSYGSEAVFNWIRWNMSQAGFSVSLWLTVVASIFVIPKIIVVKRWFPKNIYLGFLFIITAFGFYSGGTNGIRVGDANSLFLLGLASLMEQRLKLKNVLYGFLFCVLAYYTHNGTIIIILSLVLSLYVIKDVKWAIALWVGAIITSLLFGNTIAEFGASFFDDSRATSYLESGQDSERIQRFAYSGFRWDFLLYSAMPLLMGWYVLVKKKIQDKPYRILVNTYILANAVWIVFMYASYTNRFASLSWGLYPYVLLYPLVRYDVWGKRQKEFTALILIGQVVFITLF